MEYRKLGELLVSRIVYGCWAMGGHGWGVVNDQDSIHAVRRALDLGINIFDTADVYGFGHSETILSKALGSQRHDVVVATKVGVSWGVEGKISRDLSPGYVVKALENSLRRLNIDCIPLYQIHWPDPKTHITETLEALKKCQEQGKIRYIGCSNFDEVEFEALCHDNAIVSYQGPYSLIDKNISSELIKNCVEKSMCILTYGSLAKGLFSGKFTYNSVFKAEDTRSRDPNFQGEQFEHNLRLVERLKQVGLKYHKSNAQVALRWVLDTAGVSAVIAGIKTSAQIEENIGALDWSLSDKDYNFLGNKIELTEWI